MSDLELRVRPGTPALLDLSVVEEALRPAAWLQCAEHCFPGLSVRELRPNPRVGLIAGSSLGPGRLWTILSPPLSVSYDPSGALAEEAQTFSIMLQLAGATVTRQHGRSGQLNPGELCVIDSACAFELEVDGGASHFMVLQMPRSTVLGRHPYLERRTAEAFDPRESGTALLRSLLLDLLGSVEALAEDQRGAALAAVIQLLGAPRVRQGSPGAGAGWRVRAALALIDAELADPDLDAHRIASAQGISRRRLDEIMVAETGASLTARIWLRRLQQAASDLAEERLAPKSITQIAFATGFADAAHFTRAFKRRYGCTPSEWRRRRGGRPLEAPRDGGLRAPGAPSRPTRAGVRSGRRCILRPYRGACRPSR